jgi:hypothetical protein
LGFIEGVSTERAQHCPFPFEGEREGCQGVPPGVHGRAEKSAGKTGPQGVRGTPLCSEWFGCELPAHTAQYDRSSQQIYGWFTEGFDTVDLREARTLLDELSH